MDFESTSSAIPTSRRNNHSVDYFITGFSIWQVFFMIIKLKMVEIYCMIDRDLWKEVSGGDM